MAQDLIPVNPDQRLPIQQVDQQVTGMLVAMGLPTEGVLMPLEERQIAIGNAPAVVQRLGDSAGTALYISKFIAACAAGLFDAALNFIWNETIQDLRKKVVAFDLQYFFDSIVADPAERSKFRDPEDLVKLDDWQLVQGCRETGIVTDIGYRHLDYIRGMRNHVSAAHPNQNEITGLQLISWLETCVREVLSRSPEQPTVEVRRLIHNLRNQELDAANAAAAAEAIPRLPRDLRDNLLRAVFGMYIDPDLPAISRANIQLVSQTVWDEADVTARQEAGLRFATLQANGDAARVRLAREFLARVGGVVDLPEPALAAEISVALDALYSAHIGGNNFYNEPAPARTLKSRIPSSGIVPRAVRGKYVRTLLLCHVGNGYGFTWNAAPIYTELISRFSDEDMVVACALPMDSEFASRLTQPRSAEKYRDTCRELAAKTGSEQVRALASALAETGPALLPHIAANQNYQEKLAAARAALR